MLLALLSPAKRLDFQSEDDFVTDGSLKATVPALRKDADMLAARAKRYSANDLGRLMDISPALAALNFARFQAFDGARTRPAIYAFAGDVYQGFDAASLPADDIAFAQKHIGILSGLYGVLRPLDAIAPYRLEMGTRVDTERGKDLYDFWRIAVTARLNALTAKMTDATVVNLASMEYWGVVDEKALAAPVVQPVFKEIKAGKAQIVSFMAKKARGLMARYIVEHRVATAESLKQFDVAGYKYDPKASTADAWIFSRKTK
jgi:cytoplasmic iron level regulating protein YaaA (DUF328/UPF0246 family)